MKTKKVVVGAVAAAMLSLSVCSIAPAVAAGETVQISVSTAEAKAGEQFTVDVSLADIPSTGIQSTDFAIVYDNTLITIDSVKQGAIIPTNVEGVDLTGGGEAPIFDCSILNEEGCANFIWTTALEDSSYWISKSGVFCTITGTVSESAPEGTVADLKLVPRDSETYPGSGIKIDKISCGYFDDAGKKVSYGVKTVNGKVTVPSGAAEGKRGDANCDGEVRLNDAILVLQAIGNPEVYGVNGSDETHITKQGIINGDVVGGDSDKGGDGLTGPDALAIQRYTLQLITEL